MVAKILVNLEKGLIKGLINNKLTGIAACAGEIISLAGLATDSLYNNRERKI